MKDELTPEEWEAKREYERAAAYRWREKNREKYNAYQRAWYAENKKRRKEHKAAFYKRKAAEKKAAEEQQEQ